MATTTEITCACGCGRKKEVRVADVKRGWGKFYSKSCKAISQFRKKQMVGRTIRPKPRWYQQVSMNPILRNIDRLEQGIQTVED